MPKAKKFATTRFRHPVSIDPDMHDKLRERRQTHGTPIAWMIKQAVAEWLARQEITR